MRLDLVQGPTPPEGSEKTREDYISEHLRRFTQQLVDLLDSHYHRLHDELTGAWALVNETNFIPSGTILDLVAQTTNDAKIETVLAYPGVAAGNAGLIELGVRTAIVVPAGQLAIISGINLRLQATEKRRLSSVVLTNNAPGAAGGGTAGFLYLALFGREIPIGGLHW